MSRIPPQPAPYRARLVPAVLLCVVASAASLARAADAGAPVDGEAFVEARVAGRPLPVLSASGSVVSVEQAYALQDRVEARLLAQGDRRAGYKLGFTSAAARERFRVPGPVRGFLLESMSAPPGRAVSPAGYTRIFAEAEIAFRMGRRLDRAVADPDALRPFVASVHPAIELADYRFGADAAPGMLDFIADGVGARGFVLGPGRDPAGIDLAACAAVFERDGQVVGRGLGADALGDPWRALAWLANDLVAHGRALEPGDVVLTGALGPVQVVAPEAAPTDLRVRIEGVGDVEAAFSRLP